MSNIIISEDYNKAVTLHRRICANAQAAQESLYEMCCALKEMRDGKLYKELGYSNFEDYTQSELGFSRQNAYNYIAVAENLSDDFVNSSLQIGMKKLALLAKLDDTDRTEIVRNTDLESTSVRELKAEIEKLNKEKSGYKERQDKLFQKNKELVKELDEYTEKVESITADRDQERDRRQELAMENGRQSDRISSLLARVDELESKPVEVAVQTEKVPNTEAVFIAYVQAAIDAMKRLTSFCEENINCSERRLFIAKLSSISTLTDRTIERLKGV